MTGDVGLEVSGLRKSFTRVSGERITPVDDINLLVAQGEMLVLLGPSGCGKTTLLRCIAGLEQPDGGTITIRGRTVFDSALRIHLPVERRGVSMVFQTYALWPHLNVFDNVAYPLQTRRMGKQLVANRVRQLLKMTGTEALERQFPNQLSGGQQQRVALARAVAPDNGILLFDEPLSNVDAQVREQLRLEIVRMKSQFQFAGVYVTHDQQEAMEVADRIAVIDSGCIIQVGTPQEIYSRPATRHVANFVGTANELKGTITSNAGDYYQVSTAVGPWLTRKNHGGSILPAGKAVVLSWRPESTFVNQSEHANSKFNLISALVDTMLFSGPFSKVICKGPDGDVEAWMFGVPSTFTRGDSIELGVDPDVVSIFCLGDVD